MGSTDGDITEKGQAQLDKLSERCRDIDFDIIYSSPLKRAMKTAIAANKYHNVKIIADPAFAEINGGELEGYKWEELSELFPVTYGRWKNDFANFITEKGESMRQVYKRASQGAMKVIKENQGKSIVIVSHGCAIKNLFCYIRGFSVEEIDKCQLVDNASLSLFSFDENLRPHEEFSNDFSHLSDPRLTPRRMIF